MIAGVDGCKDKWIAVIEDEAGRTAVRNPCGFEELYKDKNLELIVIDIPIGLPDRGSRLADVGARRLLKHRHVCVFPAPIRPILDCPSREEACAKCLDIGNKRVNVFQWAIVPKVRRIDLALRRHKGIQDRVREGHPEVTFALMNKNTPLLSKKKTAGIEQRENLLRNYFSDLRTNTPHLEDVLDAYALLWTAKRIKLNTEQRFPETPEFDRFGMRMEIAA
jgi:predicted RNase H-like nuclease